MSVIAALNEVDDVLMFPMPREWGSLDGDVRSGLAWWALVQTLLNERASGFASPVSPLKNVAISFADDAEQMHALKLRHTCPKCRRERAELVRSMQEGTLGTVVVCQFSYTEITDLASVSRCGPRGSELEAEPALVN